MMSKKFLIIGLLIWSLVATGTTLYFWRLNNLLYDAVIASRDFAKNTNDAYKTLGECVADYDKCNPQEVKSKLLELQERADKTWTQLQEYDTQLSKYHLKK